MDDIRQGIEEALEQLGNELSSRQRDSLSIQVSEPDHLPPVAALAQLINQYGQDVGKYLETESQRQKRRSDELMQAYNALQAQTEEMNRELSMARRIQQKLLPLEDELPDRPEIKCAGYYASMSNVGGDLYDIIRIGRNAYGILIADVSGHGIPAALITALVKISFRTKIHWGVSTAEVASQVNAEIYPLLNDLDYYVTAFFCIMDLEQGTLQYTNCGHDPALVQRLSAAEPVVLDTKGRFLGAFDEVNYESRLLPLEAGDTVFVFTDGIIESRNLLDEEYGMERLVNFLADCEPLEPEDLVAAVYKDMNDFCMGAAARDDRSMFAVQFIKRTEDSHELPASSQGSRDELGNQELLRPDEALPSRRPSGDTETSALLRKEIPAALARKEWNAAVALIRTLESLGQADAGHLASLATIYYRAGRFTPAGEAARRGLTLLATQEDSPDTSPGPTAGQSANERIRKSLQAVLDRLPAKP